MNMENFVDSLSNYDFALPDDLIATTALANRSASRLMVLERHDLSPRHDVFAHIENYLKPGDVLVINNTKVMKARIEAFKPTGGRVELLLVRPLENGHWATLINGKGPFLPGATLSLAKDHRNHFIKVVKKCETERGVYEVSCDLDLQVYLEECGELPLPPYFRRRAAPVDYERYQTVYAKTLGAVAAPTAGLHFTHEHLKRLEDAGIGIAEVTLHVGPGTFLPIRCENIADHVMHTESFSLSPDAAAKLNRARKNGHRIIPVGTTSMRVVEQVMQWAKRDSGHEFFPCEGRTQIFIRPGYKFLGSDALITNFHLPRSTLLLLISAVAGRERVLRAYQEAIECRYRFFSYGDACFLEICT